MMRIRCSGWRRWRLRLAPGHTILFLLLSVSACTLCLMIRAVSYELIFEGEGASDLPESLKRVESGRVQELAIRIEKGLPARAILAREVLPQPRPPPPGTGSAGRFASSVIGIYGIFMGNYSRLAPDFLDNMDTFFLPTHPKIFYLVTDDRQLCDSLQANSRYLVECAVRQVIGWPYETLYRWHYFLDSFENLMTRGTKSPSHIFFLNSNARCQAVISQEKDRILAPFTAVLHDMFLNKSYADTPFEKNPISTAYVPPLALYKYYGARFLGASTENFLSMCRVLDTNTQIDESNGFIAAWHDESHYNHYINVVLDGEVRELGPEFHVAEESAERMRAKNVTARVLYLNKRKYIPDIADVKGKLWQFMVGGKVKPHPYFTLPVFRPSVYRALNPDLAHLSNEELREDFLAHPRERPYFYETQAFAALFDAQAYGKKYNLTSELWAKYDYIHHGVWQEDANFFVRGRNASEHVHVSYSWQKGNLMEIMERRRKAQVECLSIVRQQYLVAYEDCRSKYSGLAMQDDYARCFSGAKSAMEEARGVCEAMPL